MENNAPEHDQSAATPQTIVERLAEKIGLHARATAVYAEPVERDGVTVIPVAQVRWGFGAGGGSRTGHQEAGGGGGGLQVKPVGYIELKQGQSQFRPIRDAAALVPVILAGGAAGFLLLRAVRKLLR